MTDAETQAQAEAVGLVALEDAHFWKILLARGCTMRSRGSDWPGAFARLAGQAAAPIAEVSAEPDRTAQAAPVSAECCCDVCGGSGNCLFCNKAQ